jgi:acetyl esterase/lipase
MCEKDAGSMDNDGQRANSDRHLSARDISILKIAILASQQRPRELSAEVQHALRSGVSPNDIRAVLDDVAHRAGNRIDGCPEIMVSGEFHPDLRRAAGELSRGTDFTHDSLPLIRKAMADRRATDPADVLVVPVGKASGVRVHKPLGVQTPAAAMLWIHGGCFVVGSAAQDDALCRKFAQTLDIVVASVEYRLAPGHPFPAPLDDCAEALRWLARQPGVDPSRIAIGGGSAGGGLAAALALRTRDTGTMRPAAQLLSYPMLDDRPAGKPDPEPQSRRLMNQGMNRFGWDSYLGGVDRSEGVPARAVSLAALPPAWIGVGSLDLLLNENLEYAQRLRHAGGSCSLEVVPGAFHAFDVMVPNADISRDFFERQCDFLRQHRIGAEL